MKTNAYSSIGSTEQAAEERTDALLRLETKIERLLSLQEESLRLQRLGFLELHEFARRVGLEHKIHIIHDACADHKLAHKKEGKTVLIPLSELDRWLAEAQANRVNTDKSTTRRNNLIRQGLQLK